MRAGAANWAGALATMTDDAYYDFYPYRLRISGPDALVGLWTRLFPESGPIRCFDASAHIPATHSVASTSTTTRS